MTSTRISFLSSENDEVIKIYPFCAPLLKGAPRLVGGGDFLVFNNKNPPSSTLLKPHSLGKGGHFLLFHSAQCIH